MNYSANSDSDIENSRKNLNLNQNYVKNRKKTDNSSNKKTKFSEVDIKTITKSKKKL